MFIESKSDGIAEYLMYTPFPLISIDLQNFISNDTSYNPFAFRLSKLLSPVQQVEVKNILKDIYQSNYLLKP
jgi:hypothetical protein